MVFAPHDPVVRCSCGAELDNVDSVVSGGLE